MIYNFNIKSRVSMKHTWYYWQLKSYGQKYNKS